MIDVIVKPVADRVANQAIMMTDLRARLVAVETSVSSMGKAPAQGSPSGDRQIEHLVQNVRTLRADVNRLMEPTTESGTEVLLQKIHNRLASLEHPVVATATIQQSLEDTLPAGVPAPEDQDERQAPPIPPAREMTDPQPGGDPPGGDGDDDPDDVPKEPQDRRSKRKDKKKKKKKDSSSSSSSSSSSDTSSESETDVEDDEDEDSESEDERGGIFARTKSPKYRDLKVIQPANREYKVLLNYRHYRLRNRRQKMSTKDQKRMKRLISALSTSFTRKKFDGTDKIQVLSFLAEFVKRTDRLRMTEAQAREALPEFLKGSAEIRFNAASGVSASRSGIGSFCEAIQYLLLTYATDTVIDEALEELRTTKQKTAETELDYSSRLCEAEFRLGNVHKWHDRKLHFIDGLLSATKSLVAKFNRDKRKSTYWDVVDYAQSVGDAYRAQHPARARADPLRPAPSRAPQRYQPPARGAPKRKVYLLDQADHEDRSAHDNVDAEIYLVDSADLTQNTADTMYSTYDLSETTASSPPDDALLYADTRRGGWTPAPRIPYEDYQTTRSRPGWAGTRGGRQTAAMPQKATLCCYKCYTIGHTSPDCILDTEANPSAVKHNYEALPRALLRTVPATSYWRARDQIDAKAHNQPLAGQAATPTARSTEVHPRVLRKEDRQEPNGGNPQERVEEKNSQPQGKGY